MSLNSTPFDANVHPSRKPQISGLIAEEALTKVSDEYVDFTDVFSPDLASELPKHTGTKDHAIELVDANGFIRLSKSPVGAPRQAGKMMPFLTFSIALAEGELVWRTYTAADTLQVEGSDKKSAS